MPYVYETHLHTMEGSACGRSRGAEYITRYQDLGYAGIIVTDHFFRGNCAVSKNLPWRERVNLYCRGFENAREAGEKAGFPVFFGWEERFDFDEYLVYGLDKQWLLDHPEVERWTRREQYEAVREAGGCVVQAHPFRDRDYIPTIHLSPRLVDAVECFNPANAPENDILALRYAQRMGLPVTAGSDIHHVNHWPDDQMMGVVFEKPLESVHDYVNAIRGKKPLDIKVPKGRGEWRKNLQIHLPVEVLDENGQSTGEDIWGLLGK